jgi:hypothetical protein
LLHLRLCHAALGTVAACSGRMPLPAGRHSRHCSSRCCHGASNHGEYSLGRDAFVIVDVVRALRRHYGYRARIFR